MNDSNQLLNILRENEIVATKFHDVESKILSVLNYRDFFEVLLSEIMVRFYLPFVWISLIEEKEVTRLILDSLGESQMLGDKSRIINAAYFQALCGSSAAPLLANRDLPPFYGSFPETRDYLIKSIAIVPITLDGEIIGSLNLADTDEERFHPDFETSLLERLAMKVSICLSNVTAHEKLRFLAYHDPLTELLNRRVLEKVLKREFLRSDRYGSPLSDAFIDLDHFKSINDRYGHGAGDELLKFLASALRSMTRATDVVARFAGDEFVVVLPETGRGHTENFLKRLDDFIAGNPPEVEGNRIPFSISHGTASTEEVEFASHEALLKAADSALYEMKEGRKG